MRAFRLVFLLGVAGCSGEPGVLAKHEVEIVGTDYAFTVPEHIRAEPTALRFRNQGRVRHELNIALLKKGVRVEQVVDAIKNNQSVQRLIDGPVGVLFADPGETSSAALGIQPLQGRDYAVICIFRDSANAPRHIEKGMYSVIHVTEPAVITTPQQRADTIIGTDYAFRYPDALSAGHHSLAFENRGNVRHEMVLMLLKKGVTTDSVLKVAKENGDTDVLIDDSPGLLTAFPGKTSLGRLEVDLLPGREYTVACFFSEGPRDPPHVALGMYGSIQVTGKPGG